MEARWELEIDLQKHRVVVIADIQSRGGYEGIKTVIEGIAVDAKRLSRLQGVAAAAEVSSRGF